MAKQSKYVNYEGKRVNEVSEFKVPSSQNYLITKFNGGEKRVSSSGRKYYVYKLQLENGVWINVNMFNKYVKRGYFSKQLVKKVQDSKVVKVFDFDNSNLPFIEVPKVKVKTSRLSIDDLLDIHEQTLTEIGNLTSDLADILYTKFSNFNWKTGELLYNDFNDYYDENVSIWFDKYDNALENGNSEYDIFTYYNWKYTVEPQFKNMMKELWQFALKDAKYTQHTYFLKQYKQLDLQNAKKLHKQLARKYHTDNLETGNVEMFKVIQNTYEEYMVWFEKQSKKRKRKNKKTVLTQQTQQTSKLYLLA